MRSWQSCGWPLSWPEAARPSPPSSLPSTAGLPGGTRAFPRWAVAVHLCPRNAATWRNRPRLPSKAYSAAGQAASALHAMAILQVHQGKVLKQVHEGSTDPGWCRIYAWRLTSLYEWRKSQRGSSGRWCPQWWSRSAISGSTWQRWRTSTRHVPRRPHLPGGAVRRHRRGLCPAVLCVQQQTEAIQHILPRRDAPTTAAPGARPQSGHRGRPSASSRAAPPQAESTPRPARRASRRRAAPNASQPGPKSSRKSMKRPWPGQPRDVGVCFFSGDGENSAAPSLGGGPGGESYVSFLFLFRRWSKESAVRGSSTSLRTSGQSRLEPREFGEDASERVAFCTSSPTPLRCTTTGTSIARWSRLHGAQPSPSRWLTRTIRLGYEIQFTRTSQV